MRDVCNKYLRMESQSNFTVRQRLHALLNRSDVYMFFREKGKCNLLVDECGKLLVCDDELTAFFQSEGCQDWDVRYNDAFNEELAEWPDLTKRTYDDDDEDVLQRLSVLERDMLLASTYDVCHLDADEYNEDMMKVWSRLQAKYPKFFGELYPHVED